MKVFVSWSGDRSREVANLLRDWILCVLQAVRPWVSTRDIDRGSLWFGEISGQLNQAGVGIICLTAENKEQPWILFEAGALAKGLSTSRVCTLLIDLQPGDIKDPLAQFNHTMPTKEGMYALVTTLNALLEESGLDAKTFETVFDTNWPQFESGLARILENTQAPPPTVRKKGGDAIDEVLETVRTMSNRLARLENGAQIGASSNLKVFSKNMHVNMLARATVDSEAKKLRAEGNSFEWIEEELKKRFPDSVVRSSLMSLWNSEEGHDG